MSLLTDDDKALLVLEHLGPAALAGDTMSLYDCFQLALDVAEKAILEKLASAELPEPEYMPLLLIGAKHSSENVGERSFTEAGFYSAACEIFKLGQSQAYAQGAAAQLAEKPVGEVRESLPIQPNGLTLKAAFLFNTDLPARTPLYTRRQA